MSLFQFPNHLHEVYRELEFPIRILRARGSGIPIPEPSTAAKKSGAEIGQPFVTKMIMSRFTLLNFPLKGDEIADSVTAVPLLHADYPGSPIELIVRFGGRAIEREVMGLFKTIG